jgi:hypothetical protein
MTEKLLIYTYHENDDVHEFKPLISTRDVIQPYMDVLDRIMPETIEQNKPCALILWDLTDTQIFPLRLQKGYFKKMVEKYPKIPIAYVAYLTDRHSDITLINAHFTVRKDTRKIFSTQQHQDAIDWLTDCRGKLS